VSGALWDFEPLRTTKARVSVTADGAGVVTLEGNVCSDMLRAVAGRLAARVPGVSEVRNELVTDAQIASEVASELGHADVALFTDQLDVESRMGVVYVGGTVAAADRAAADAALNSVVARIATLPGVHEVFNRAVVVEASASAETAGESAAGGEAGGAEQAEMQERLRIWKERVAAKGG
jgi:osmotically-inducible protein OsmY